MSSTPNNNFTIVGDGQLDAWDTAFKADLEYFNQHGIERSCQAQGLNAFSMSSSYSSSTMGIQNSADPIVAPRQTFSTFGDGAHWDTLEHETLAPTLRRVEPDAEIPYPRPLYPNNQGPKSRVDEYQYQYPAVQKNLEPYAGQIVDVRSGFQDLQQTPVHQLAQGPERHVDDQGFENQGHYHADQTTPILNAGEIVDDDEVQFLGSILGMPNPTGPNAAGPSASTTSHISGERRGSSIQHVDLVASQNNGDGVPQMSFQDTQPVANSQQARRTPKGRTTKRDDDTRQRPVRPGPAGGLTLELYNPDTGNWDPAIRHADIRDQILWDADQEATQFGGYDFAPARGEKDTDRTSFVRAHKTWGPERANRPEINFIFDRPCRPLPAYVRPCSQPVPWLWRGYIVLDHFDDPMRLFEDCPTVLSSAVEGFRIDAIQKRNPAITTLDLWGRLPPQHTKRGAVRGIARTKELNTTQAVTNVAWRWRHKACVLSWERRAGWELTRGFLKEFLTPQQLTQNTTRGREDLTKEEVKELEEYVQSAKAAKRANRPVPTPPRRNNVDVTGATLLPDADADQSLPSAEYMQHGYGNPSNQNLASHFLEPHIHTQHLQQAYVDPTSQKLDISLLGARGQARFPEQGNGNPISQDLGLHTHRAQAPNQWRSMQQPSRSQVYADATKVSSSPRGLKRKAKTIEECDWKETSRETDNTFHRPGDPLIRDNNGDVSHLAKRPRQDSIPDRAASPVAPHTDLIDVQSANKGTRALGEEAAYRNDENEPAPGRPVSNHEDAADAIRNKGSERYCYSPEEQYVVASGYEPVVFPIGSITTIFSPDGVTVQQGVIAKNTNTLWTQRDIAETIRALQNAGAVTGVDPQTDDTSPEASLDNFPQGLDGTPSEATDKNLSKKPSIGYKRSAPGKEWLFSVPLGLKAFQFPIGDTKICFMESDMEVRRATLAADGETVWYEMSRPEAISVLENMRVRRQTPISPTNGNPEQELKHDIVPSSTPPIIASQDNIFGGSDVGMETGTSDDSFFGGSHVDMEAGANGGLRAAPIAVDADPDKTKQKSDQIGAESEQHPHEDDLPTHGQEFSARLEAVQPVANATTHGELEGVFQYARSPNSQAGSHGFSAVNSAANPVHGTDLKLPVVENHRSAANPNIAPSLRELIIRGALRSRSALEQHAYTKKLLGEDEMLILIWNKIDVPTCFPERFEWCEGSKRWVSTPPPREDATLVRAASPEKDDFNWEDYINSEYLEETGEPN